jgi:hypothetical protein
MVGDARATPEWSVAAAGTEQSFAGQALQLAPRTLMETQGGGLVADHAWETSFGESDRSDHQHASQFSHKSNPKTIALFLKRKH